MAMMRVRAVFQDITAIGGIFFYGVVTLATLLLGKYLILIRLLLGIIILVLLTVLLRSIFYTNRPLAQEYKNVLEKLDAASFPSLHSAKAVFMALTLMNSNVLYNIFLAVLALSVGYSRIYLKKHDWIDVGVGFIVGGLVYLIISLW